MFPRVSLGTLAQPRGRPRSPESATQLTGDARDRCLGAGADTRIVSGQRDREGDEGSSRCVQQANNWDLKDEEDEYLATSNDCLPARTRTRERRWVQ